MLRIAALGLLLASSLPQSRANKIRLTGFGKKEGALVPMDESLEAGQNAALLRSMAPYIVKSWSFTGDFQAWLEEFKSVMLGLSEYQDSDPKSHLEGHTWNQEFEHPSSGKLRRMPQLTAYYNKIQSNKGKIKQVCEIGEKTYMLV
jgi:hypothetical protein